MSSLRIKNFLNKLFYVYSSSIINGVLGILLIRYMIDRLGFEGYGIYSVYVIAQSYLLLLDSSVTRSLVRSIIENGRELTAFEAHVSAFWLVAVVLFLALPFVCSWEIIGSVNSGGTLIAFAISIAMIEFIGNIFISVRQSYQMADENFKAISIFSLLSGIIRYSIIFLVLYANLSVVWVIGFMLVKKLIEIAVASKLYAIPFTFLSVKPNPSEGWRVLTTSAPITLAQVGQTGLITVPALVAGRFLGVEGLGIFRSMFDLASRIWFLSNGLGLIIFPLFAKLRSRIDDRVLKSLALVNAVSIFSYLSLLSVILVFVGYLQNYIRLDNGMVGGLVITLIGMFINAHSNMMYEMMQSFGKPLLVVYATLLALLPYGFILGQNQVEVYTISLCWAASQIVFMLVMDVLYLRLLGGSKYNIVKVATTLAGCACLVSLYYYETVFSLLLMAILGGGVVAFSLLMFVRQKNTPGGKTA